MYLCTTLPIIAQNSERESVDVVVIGGQSGYRYSDNRVVLGLYGSNNYFIAKSIAIDMSFSMLFPPSYLTTNNTLGLRFFQRKESFDMFVRGGIGFATQTLLDDIGTLDGNLGNSGFFDTKSKFSIGYNISAGVWYKNIEIAISTMYSPLSQQQIFSGIYIGYVFR